MNPYPKWGIAAWVYTALAVLAWLLFPSTAFGLPDLIRHGYTSCTACHYSPAGGGLLNEYGKVQSSEILSTFIQEPVSLHFLDALSLGGQLRALQTVRQNALSLSGRYFLMQADVMAGIQHHGFTAVGSFDLVRKRFDAAWGMYSKAFDTFEIALRAGIFMPNVGVNLADHFLSVRQNFQPGTEEPGVELSAHTQSVSLSLQAGKTLAVRAAMNIWDSEFGFSYSSRSWGPFAVISLGKEFFTVLQWNVNQSYLASLEWELVKGLRVYTMLDAGEPGVGARWYPRPNLEIRFHGQRGQFQTTGFALAHFYL